MPIDCSVDRDRKIISTTCRGKITRQEFFDHQRVNGSDESLFGFDEILDTREADFSEFDHLALQSIAQVTGQLPAIDSNAVLAVLVSEGNTKIIVELYQMVEKVVNGSGREIQFFQRPDEAYSWVEKYHGR